MRGIHLADVSCPMCRHHTESVNHLLLHCHMADLFWTSIAQWCNIPSFKARSIEHLYLISKASSNKNEGQRKLKAIFTIGLWFLWKARNDMVFNNIQWSVSRLTEEVKIWSVIWINNRHKKGSHIWNSWKTYISPS
ncbi:hypothetical protein QVD17_20966 [Tagetes erecta]|uniref:Reverse transcriptase zinc-binding domain-containing protein n=1 Tax=Tagetes erecta TaxID=13708 RepID=A0AAD8NYF8_TARER|nr:hypothetical protein QVD17_20966 [Tagetes erecta]